MNTNTKYIKTLRIIMENGGSCKTVICSNCPLNNTENGCFSSNNDKFLELVTDKLNQYSLFLI